jgi:outer membrane protein assembly factor BamA
MRAELKRVVAVLIGVLIALSYSAAQEKNVVRGIEISGLHLTRRWVVERELQIAVGDSVTEGDVAAARKRLQNQIAFNDVQLQLDSAGTLSAHVTEAWPLWPIASVDLAEGQLSDIIKRPHDFLKKATIYAGAYDFNLTGSGERLLAAAQFGAAEGAAIRFRTRWLAPRWPLAVQAGVENLRVLDRHASVLDSTRHLRNVQFDLDVATREGAPTRVGLKISYQAVRQEKLWPAEGRNLRTLRVYPYVILDRRDLEWYPTRGSWLSVGGDAAFGDARFIRSQYEACGYAPVTRAARPPVLALRGYAATSSRSTPSWARYYYGFNQILRGNGGDKSESSDVLIGDAEVRFPLTRETTYSVPLLGRYGRRWPFGLYGMIFVERAELKFNGERTEWLGWGGGLYVRVPYAEIIELSASENQQGHFQLFAGSGVSF